MRTAPQGFYPLAAIRRARRPLRIGFAAPFIALAIVFASIAIFNSLSGAIQ